MSVRCLGRGACAALAAICIGVTSARAGYVPPPPDVHPQPTLSPPLEKWVVDHFAKLRAGKQKLWEARMQQEIAAIAKVTNLSADGQKALEAPAQQAIAVSLDPWLAKIDWGLRGVLATASPAQAAQIIADRTKNFSDWIPSTTLNCLQPFEQDVWIKALHQVLTSDQMAAWDKARADACAQADEEGADKVKAAADRFREVRMNVIKPEIDSVEMAVDLGADRAAKLEALAKSVVDITVDRFRGRMFHLIEVMNPDDRRRFLAQPDIFVPAENDEMPALRPEWINGVAQILTADEKTRMAAEDKVRRQRRTRSLGLLMIMMLDERIAFTEQQRQKLQPIVERLLQDNPDFFPKATSPAFNATSQQLFYVTAQKATDAELKPVLDDLQIQHWRNLVKDSIPADSVGDDASVSEAKDTGSADVEETISDFLYDRAEKERMRSLEGFVIKAEDAVRVVGLDAAAAAQLQVAARGAHEEYLSNWKWFTEQQVRAQLQDVTPQNVRERLANIQDYFFRQNFGTNVNQNWENTVSSELSGPQRAAWQKEIAARADYRSNAIAAYVLAEFDLRFDLTAAQCDRLAPIVAGVMHDNSDGFASTFGGFADTPWYLQGFYTLIPMMGVPDKDLDDILTKYQMKRWTSSGEYANASNFWNSIQQMQNRHVQVQGRVINQW